jgi:peptide/nickel transport system ATP-binding protein
MNAPLLEIKNLRTYFDSSKGIVRAVDGASYSVGRGEFLCLIGESGCGKSVSALSLLGLVDGIPGIVDGEIFFDGGNILEGLRDVCSLSLNDGAVRVEKDVNRWRRMHRERVAGIRGKRIGMIFQDPVSSLNPLFTAGDHIAEALRLREKGLSKKACRDRAIEWLGHVKIKNPEEVVHAYPFHLSGGMCQRVMIATALAASPDLLIADEPTTALDATVQLEILELLKSIQKEFNLAILFITHDISIATHFADSIAVMYAGKVVEKGPVSNVFAREGNHPYTDGLLRAAMKVSGEASVQSFISGSPPDATNYPSGCPFHPRCNAMETLPDNGERCRREDAPEVAIAKGHMVRCWKFDSSAGAG